MNVANQRRPVRLVGAHTRLRPTLEDMPDLVMRPIARVRGGLLDARHEARERGVPRLHEEVDVMRHEAIGVDPHRTGAAVPGQPVERGGRVVRPKERPLPTIPPHNDVVQQARSKHPWPSRHAGPRTPGDPRRRVAGKS